MNTAGFHNKGVAWLTMFLVSSLCIFLVLLHPVTVHAAPPIDVTQLQGQLNLAEHVETIKDFKRELSLEKFKANTDAPWVRYGKSIFDPSYENAAWWLRFTLANQGTETKDLILELGWPLLDLLDVYVLKEGKIESSWQTGDTRPTAGKPIPSRSYAFPLKIPAGETRQILIKIDLLSSTYDLIPITLFTEDSYYTEKQIESLLLGAYFGAILALLIYNFMIYCSFRERNFLLYVIYLATFLIFNLGFLGYGYQYIWKDSVFWNSLFGLGISIPLIFASTAFVVDFLESHKRAPRTHRALWILSWLSVVWLVALVLNILGVSIPMNIIVPLLSINIIALGLLYWLAGVITLRQGFRPARYYTLAWSFVIVGVFIYQLSQVPELLPDSVFVRYSVLIGNVSELLLLSLAIGNKYKIMRDESMAAVQRATRVQSEYALNLETQVREQTAEIRNAMSRIETLARTDALTQLMNRRAFNEILEREIGRANRLKLNIALCVLDIDDFKGYNDHYGHIEGDSVLSKIGQTMRTHFRRPTDFTFRIGGEEFAVLLTDIGSNDDTEQFVESFRHEVASLNIPHAKSAFGKVTASFGLVIIESCQNISMNDLHGGADEALYEAKSAGKNRVVTRVRT